MPPSWAGLPVATVATKTPFGLFNPIVAANGSLTGATWMPRTFRPFANRVAPMDTGEIGSLARLLVASNPIPALAWVWLEAPDWSTPDASNMKLTLEDVASAPP